MMQASVRIVCPPGKRNEMSDTLCSMLEPTRVEHGCVSCRFYRDAQRPNVFTLVEEWLTPDDLQRHLRSDQYRKLLALIDLSTEKPEIKFSAITKTSGIEYLVAARSG